MTCGEDRRIVKEERGRRRFVEEGKEVKEGLKEKVGGREREVIVRKERE